MILEVQPQLTLLQEIIQANKRRRMKLYRAFFRVIEIGQILQWLKEQTKDNFDAGSYNPGDDYRNE